MDRPDRPHRTRVRRIDWATVTAELDRRPPGTPVLIGRLNRSVATQINKGQYPNINPAIYQAWSKDWNGKTSEIWMMRKP